jgi:hypothetical protein
MPNPLGAQRAGNGGPNEARKPVFTGFLGAFSLGLHKGSAKRAGGYRGVVPPRAYCSWMITPRMFLPSVMS